MNWDWRRASGRQVFATIGCVSISLWHLIFSSFVFASHAKAMPSMQRIERMADDGCTLCTGHVDGMVRWGAHFKWLRQREENEQNMYKAASNQCQCISFHSIPFRLLTTSCSVLAFECICLHRFYCPDCKCNANKLLFFSSDRHFNDFITFKRNAKAGAWSLWRCH